MATTPTRPDDAPRSDEPPREATPVPDQDGPHDVPDDEVIEKTLPEREKR